MQDIRIENSTGPINTLPPSSLAKPIQRHHVLSSSIESKDESCLGSVWSSFTSFVSSIWNALRRCFGCPVETFDNRIIESFIEEENARLCKTPRNGDGNHLQSIENRSDFTIIDHKIIESFIEEENELLCKTPRNGDGYHLQWIENRSDFTIIDHKIIKQDKVTKPLANTEVQQIATAAQSMLDKKAEPIAIRSLWIMVEPSTDIFDLCQQTFILFGEGKGRSNKSQHPLDLSGLMKVFSISFKGRIPADIDMELSQFIVP